jgi:hypothetical protein
MNAGGDLELLVAEMVEIENHGICLAAVLARVAPEVLKQEQDAFAKVFVVPHSRLLDVALLVRRVMLFAIRAAAGSAVAVIAAATSLWREVRERLRLLAPATSPQLLHEQMFAPEPDGILA